MRCAYIKSGGEQCRARAMEGFSQCYNHRPDLAEQRRRNASKGGKAGGNGRPSPARNLELIDKTLAAIVGGLLGLGKNPLRVDRGDAAVVIQACNTRIRLAEVERRMAEYEDLMGRVEELEQLVEEMRRWVA